MRVLTTTNWHRTENTRGINTEGNKKDNEKGEVRKNEQIMR